MENKKTEIRSYTLREVFTLLAGTLFLFMALETILPAGIGKWRLLILEASLMVPLAALMIVERGTGLRYLRWHRVSPVILLGAVLTGLGMTPIFDEINRLFQMMVPMNPAIHSALMDVFKANDPMDWILIIGAAVVVAGLVEETLFRGFVQSVFESKGDIAKAVLLTSFLFAVLHFNPWWFIEILILGVLLGAMARITDSIFPGALAHGLYNGLGITLLNLQPQKGYEMGVHVAPQWIISGAVSVVAGLWLIHRFSVKKIEDTFI
ncbi:CPBP family intramembrane metalloprotease [bacterium]|nr:CPBP family intramembrane metalloprotease [bacterium]